MSVQTYTEPSNITVEGLAPSTNYNPSLGLKMRVIAYLTALENNSYSLNMNIEHYLENDPNKETVRQGVVQPYVRQAIVNSQGRAYRNLANGETKIPPYNEDGTPDLTEFENSPFPWMREIEYFNFVFNTQEVVMSQFIAQVITEQHARGVLN